MRGQNNVQGACDLGGLPNVYSGYQVVTLPPIKAKFEAAWEVEDLSDQVGLTVTEMMERHCQTLVVALMCGGRLNLRWLGDEVMHDFRQRVIYGVKR